MDEQLPAFGYVFRQQRLELALAKGWQDHGLWQLGDTHAIQTRLKQRAEIIADEATGQLQHLHAARTVTSGLHKKGRALLTPGNL